MSEPEAYQIDLWIPGPTWNRPEVMTEMSQYFDGHRTEWMELKIADIRQGIFELTGADPQRHNLVLAGGSGTTALEIAARSWGDPTAEKPQILAPAIGLFGELWSNVFESNGVKVAQPRLDDGEVLDPGRLDEWLSKDPYKVVALTHVDTSTGTINPLDKLAPIVKKHGAMLFVDAVSSVGGVEVDVSKLDIDYLVTAPQKALGVPPSVGIAVVSNEALAQVIKSPRGWETDVVLQTEKNAENRTLTTPAIPQLGALALQLDYIQHTEGVEQRYQRHTEMADITRGWAADEGFELLPAALNAADTVTCIVNDQAIDLDAWQDYLRYEQSYGFDAGHEKLNPTRVANGHPETFRIAHMGDHSAEQLHKYLDTLSASINQFRQ